MSPLVILAPVVTLAFVVEATAGFGATVVCVTLATHFLPLEYVLAVFLPLNVVLSSTISVRNRAHIDWGVLKRDVASVMLPGMCVGMTLFAFREHTWIRGTFAALVVMLATQELLRLHRNLPGDTAPLANSRRISALFGAGLVHGLFASGGPLLVYVVGRELHDKARFRATLSAVWLGLNAVLLARYLMAGTLTRETLTVSAVLLVPLGVGLFVGDAIHHAVDPRKFRLGVFILLFVAGASLLARSF